MTTIPIATHSKEAVVPMSAASAAPTLIPPADPATLEAAVRRLLRHQERVATMALYLVPMRDAATLREAARLHDYGRLPLLATTEKSDPLTDNERAMLRIHAPLGALLVRSLGFSAEVVAIVRHHHERYDGTGVPDRLAGKAIPLGARVLAVADAVVAMAEARAYDPPRALEQVRAELVAHRGTQFDPELVDHALRVLTLRAIHTLLAVEDPTARW